MSLCPELDITSQGDTVEQARNNLKEASELFFETASPEEINQRLHEDVFVTQYISEFLVVRRDGQAVAVKSQGPHTHLSPMAIRDLWLASSPAAQ